MASLAENSSSASASASAKTSESVSGGQRLGGKDGEQSFFYYYGQLAHQQNMLQDTTRTGAYYNAICDQARAANFHGKVVMDVGTGTGILAMFAAKAGAKKVYAVEASAIASTAKELVKANGLDQVVEVFNCKVREQRSYEAGRDGGGGGGSGGRGAGGEMPSSLPFSRRLSLSPRLISQCHPFHFSFVRSKTSSSRKATKRQTSSYQSPWASSSSTSGCSRSCSLLAIAS